MPQPRLDSQAGTPVQAHQGLAAEARRRTRGSRGDRGAHRQQGAGPRRRIPAAEPLLDGRHLVGTSGWSPLASRTGWAHVCTALRRGTSSQDRWAVEDDETPARTCARAPLRADRLAADEPGQASTVGPRPPRYTGSLGPPGPPRPWRDRHNRGRDLGRSPRLSWRHATASPGSDRRRRIDLDLPVALANTEARERRERLREHVVQHVAVQREGGSVTRALEPVLGLVVAQQAALVGAHARNC